MPGREQDPAAAGPERGESPTEPRWLTVEEVAAELRLPVRSAREYVRIGRIPGARFGRHWRVRRDVLDGLGR